MTLQRMGALMALLLIAILGVGVFSEMAYAQDSTEAKGNDKSTGSKQGFNESLSSAEDSELANADGATKTQMAIGAGSFVVMIIVLKWL